MLTFGTKRKQRRCGTCENCKTGTAYGVPVCYEVGKIGGERAATEVSLSDTRMAGACAKYREEKASGEKNGPAADRTDTALRG